MIVTDAAQLGDSSTRFVVIGSGAVGLYAASELVKRGKEVVLIESGARHLGNFDGSFRSVGNKNEGIKIGRSRTLGGTTNLWGGQLVEFQPVDFAGRDWLPGSKWPVTYEEIAPFYKTAYENLGLEPATHNDDAVWKSVSSKRPDMGTDLEGFLTRWLKIPNFAVYYDSLIQQSPLLKVLTEHTAIKIRGDSAGTITSVQVRDPKGTLHEIQGSTFILAAGTIESCRLLLHSAADTSWPCPWKNNDNVGAYFQDHLGVMIATVQANDSKRFFGTFCTIAKSGHKYQPKIRFKNEVLAREPLTNIQGFFGFESSASEHLVYLKQFLRAALYSRKITGLKDLLKNATTTVKYLFPLMWKYIWDHRVFVPSTSKVMLHIQGEQIPVRESRVKIDPTVTDQFGLPQVVLDWKVTGKELDSIREFALRVDKALQASGLAKLKIEEPLQAGDPKFIERCFDTYHQAGGTIMGRSESDGVVDKNLKVFGTANLYIGGASTFRTVSNANTTFNAISFATRLVDHLCRS